MRWQRPTARTDLLRDKIERLKAMQGTLTEQAAACREQAEKLRELAAKAKQREQEEARGRVDPS